MKPVAGAVLAFFLTFSGHALAGGGGGGGDRPVKVPVSMDWDKFPLILWPERAPLDKTVYSSAENERRKFCTKNPTFCSQSEKDRLRNPLKPGHCGDVYPSYDEAMRRCPNGAHLIPNFRSRSQWTCHCYGHVDFPE